MLLARKQLFYWLFDWPACLQAFDNRPDKSPHFDRTYAAAHSTGVAKTFRSLRVWVRMCAPAPFVHSGFSNARSVPRASTKLSVLQIQSIGPTDYTFQAIRDKISHRIRMSATPTNHPPDYPKNMVGPQIRRCRNARGWSQAKLALRLQLDGLNISREVLAQMECQIHCIRDNHIFHFARALAVNASDFFAGLEK